MALSGGSGGGEFQTRSAEKVAKFGRMEVSLAMEDVLCKVKQSICCKQKQFDCVHVKVSQD